MASPGYLGTSQNGWPVYDDAHFQDHAVRTSVEGVGFWSANADVAVVMDDFTQKYHDRIEHITLPVSEYPGYDDWSRALRPVRGQTTGYSNHGSCTARDLNSTRHPRGKHGTYTDLKRKGLWALVNDDLYVVNGRSVLRDGEFYQTGTIDGMHVEANQGPAAFKIVADRIRAKGKLIMDKADESKIRDILVDVLKNEKIVPNRPTAAQLAADPKTPTTYFSVVSVLANVETDQDNDRAWDHAHEATPPKAE
jgi:hypothetical protein